MVEVKAEVQVEGMELLEELIKKHEELLRELSDNVAEMERVRLRINLKLNQAAPVIEQQERRLELFTDIRPPVNTVSFNNPFSRNNGGSNNTSRYCGGPVNYEAVAIETFSNIDKRLGVLCSLLENLSVSLGIMGKSLGVFGESGVIDNSSIKTPVKTVE